MARRRRRDLRWAAVAGLAGCGRPRPMTSSPDRRGVPVGGPCADRRPVGPTAPGGRRPTASSGTACRSRRPVLKAVVFGPDVPGAEAAAHRGAAYLAGRVRDDGSIDDGPTGLVYPVYTAAASAIVLTARADPRGHAGARRLARRARRRQLDRVARLDARRPGLGGWGYAVEPSPEAGQGHGPPRRRPLVHPLRRRCAAASPAPGATTRPSPGPCGSSSGARTSRRGDPARRRRLLLHADRPGPEQGRRAGRPPAGPLPLLRQRHGRRPAGPPPLRAGGWITRGSSRPAAGSSGTSRPRPTPAPSSRSASRSARRPITTTPGRSPTPSGPSALAPASERTWAADLARELSDAATSRRDVVEPVHGVEGGRPARRHVVRRRCAGALPAGPRAPAVSGERAGSVRAACRWGGRPCPPGWNPEWRAGTPAPTRGPMPHSRESRSSRRGSGLRRVRCADHLRELAFDGRRSAWRTLRRSCPDHLPGLYLTLNLSLSRLAAPIAPPRLALRLVSAPEQAKGNASRAMIRRPRASTEAATTLG